MSDKWLRERQQKEGLLLNADSRHQGMSPVNPLQDDLAVNKSLRKRPKPAPTVVPPQSTTLQAVEACSTGQAAIH
ncbi:MAG: hypothetical protein R3C19_24215 [Planctomycetaceae bacterium]